MMGIEPMTSSLPRKCSTPELHRPVCELTKQQEKKRAGDEARTRDPQLGRLMLYQLSYSRLCCLFSLILTLCTPGGGSRIRTYEGIRQQIYSLPQLAALVSPRLTYLCFQYVVAYFKIHPDSRS